VYDPKDLLKRYLYGYMNRIRSSRRLETENGRNLEALWLPGKLCPYHKTIAEFRRRNGELLKNVFKGFVKLRAKPELDGKELVATDGSKFKAVNSRDRNWTEGKRKERLKKNTEEYLREMEEAEKHSGASVWDGKTGNGRRLLPVPVEREGRRRICAGVSCL
jgi:transposase